MLNKRNIAVVLVCLLVVSMLSGSIAFAANINKGDKAIEDVKDRIDKIEKKGKVNRGQIRSLIQAIRKLDENLYTKESWQALEKAIEQAEAVLKKSKPTQGELEAVLTAIIKAFRALVIQPLKAVGEVMAMIEALPSQDNITLAHKPIVIEARSAYEALSKREKALVVNLYKLEQAEEKISQLEFKLDLEQLETVGGRPEPVPPEYVPLFQYMDEGAVIPALSQDYIPQGVAYIPQRDWLIGTMHYDKKDRPSILVVLDRKTGKLVKAFNLYLDSANMYNGHAGGVAVSKRNIWIASGEKVYRFDLMDVVRKNHNERLIAKSIHDVETRASFVGYNDGILWVGEFTIEKSHKDHSKYPNKEAHHMNNRDGEEYLAWTVGYRLENDNFPTDGMPDYILSHTNRIQGIDFSKDNIYLSHSYGRTNNSYIYRYDNVLKEPPHREVTLNGQEVPLWFLDGKSNKKRIALPPLSEDIALYHNYLYIMFESGADKYRTATNKYPLDRIQVLDITKFDYIEEVQAIIN